MAEIAVREASWCDAQTVLSAIRQQVFIIEQQVPEALEWDGLDKDAIHLLAFSTNNSAIGCARIVAGTIGRMAVIAGWRNRGVGRALLQAAIGVCRKRGWREISISAQVHAIGFYENAGFVVSSDVYMDAGIIHRDMKLKLTY